MENIHGIVPVVCRDERMLEAMRYILVEGRASKGSCYYVHVGDLNWWLFYLDRGWQRQDRIFLWEREVDRRLIGWSLLSPQAQAFDLFMHPSALDGELRWQLYEWTMERMGHLVRAQGGNLLRTMWVAEDDAALLRYLEGHGFERHEYFLLRLECPLQGPLPEYRLPEGFRVRAVTGEEEAARRAEASHAAFGSGKPLDVYVENYRRFMRSPVYEAKRDLVVESPDGQVVSFAIYWLDHVNREGYFEPVGTHPAFRCRGLGRAVLAEGLRQMAAQGMVSASVCVESDNLAAQALYRSAGFAVVRSIGTYARVLSDACHRGSGIC